MIRFENTIELAGILRITNVFHFYFKLKEKKVLTLIQKSLFKLFKNYQTV